MSKLNAGIWNEISIRNDENRILIPSRSSISSKFQCYERTWPRRMARLPSSKKLSYCTFSISSSPHLLPSNQNIYRNTFQSSSPISETKKKPTIFSHPSHKVTLWVRPAKIMPIHMRFDIREFVTRHPSHSMSISISFSPITQIFIISKFSIGKCIFFALHFFLPILALQQVSRERVHDRFSTQNSWKAAMASYKLLSHNGRFQHFSKTYMAMHLQVPIWKMEIFKIGCSFSKK